MVSDPSSIAALARSKPATLFLFDLLYLDGERISYRALDVEREARSRLRPLKRQAEAAELHARLERQALELRWELAGDALRDQLQGTGLEVMDTPEGTKVRPKRA